MQNPLLLQNRSLTNQDIFLSDVFRFGFLSLGLIALTLSGEIINGSMATLLIFFLNITIFFVFIYAGIRHRNGTDISVFMFFPVFISATQNLYLMTVAYEVSTTQMQLMIVLNFVFSAMLVLLLLLSQPKQSDAKPTQLVLLLLGMLVIFSFVTFALFHGATIVTMLASLRNVVAPMMFFLVGILGARFVRPNVFYSYILVLGLFVAGFGIIELFLFPGFWKVSALPELWIKKGLPINEATGLPHNFFSSELINGQPQRRMVSSFADPVNLGTFIFIVFAISWYLKRYILMWVFIAVAALAISKGAFLGIMIFLVVLARIRGNQFLGALVTAVCIVGGIGFIAFSMTSSNQSLAMHVSGLTNSIIRLPSHPLGTGLGSVGVLAHNEAGGKSIDIAESGLGVVIGQLGVVGLMCYAAFFAFLFKWSNRLSDSRDRTFALSLTLAILVNIAFNEVALSPNSCAAYFMAIGIMVYSSIKNYQPKPKVAKKKKKTEMRYNKLGKRIGSF